jgi:2,4-dienoyl-CoA reductase-like NADH-dependent reductase (Old Yellow Enzyme family)
VEIPKESEYFEMSEILNMEVNMSLLFTPASIGNLEIPNRIVRSATAERMANNLDGRVTGKLKEMWENLVRGGTGLIITGHMYVHPSGKCHPEMTGIYDDDLIPELSDAVKAVHDAGGKIAVQINHGGMQCSKEAILGAMAPSAIDVEFLEQPAREMSADEIGIIIDSYAQAARRAVEAGFDAVQLHGAHGYLINQFISPYINKRTDAWGGDLSERSRFLREIVQAVRAQVGMDYPLFIKFGMEDGVDDGLSAENGAEVISWMKDMNLDAVEISGGILAKNSMKGIKSEDREAYFRPLAQIAQSVTDLPIILVGGMRSRKVMEDVLGEGDADFIALCRPLINEPDFPKLLKSGVQEKSECISSNNCWPTQMGEGIACKCPSVERSN